MLLRPCLKLVPSLGITGSTTSKPCFIYFISYLTRLANQSLSAYDEQAKKYAEFLEEIKSFEGTFAKTDVAARLNFLVLKNRLQTGLEVLYTLFLLLTFSLTPSKSISCLLPQCMDSI